MCGVGRILRTAVPLLLVALVAALAWLAFTGARAVAAVRDVRVAAEDIRSAVSDADLAALQVATSQASDAAFRADDALDDPVWAMVAAIPYVGDTAEVARVTASAVAAAAEGIGPLLEVSDVLDPVSLYVDGRVAVERLQEAQNPLAAAAEELQRADEIMAQAPAKDDGAWVLQGIDDQRVEAAEELSAAARAVTLSADTAAVAPDLFGIDGPRTWFVGVQSPAEARGTGGVVGNFVILTAEDGKLTLQGTGSNTELALLESIPDFGEEFFSRYGADPALIANTNLSPHFPYAARMWLETYAEETGVRPDVVMGTDVVAFRDILEATGPIEMPDGRVIDADNAVDFGLVGVYEEFPDSNERSEYQEDVSEQVFDALTTRDVNARALVTAVGRMAAENRLLLWSPNEAVEQVLADLPTSGSVAAEPGPYVYPVVINGTASKLDTYLTRDYTYEVGRCDVSGQVASRTTLVLESSIPADAVLPEYVVAQAVIGPSGPISNVQLQIHLSEGAEVTGITIDGEPVTEWYAFEEEGRPAVLLVLDLVPREPASVVLEFNEPTSDLPAQMPDQPLAQPAEISIEDVPCPSAE